MDLESLGWNFHVAAVCHIGDAREEIEEAGEWYDSDDLGMALLSLKQARECFEWGALMALMWLLEAEGL